METAECRLAFERISAYLEDPNQDQAEIEMAIDHINGCPYCRTRLGYLARALANKAEDELTCQACEELLPEYVQAEAAGQAGVAHWQPVARHLATCPHCSAAYQALAELSRLAYGEQGFEPEVFFKPKLSFLDKERSPTWYLDEWGRLIVQFSESLLRNWQPPALAPAGLKKSSMSSSLLFEFLLKGEIEDLEITITATANRNDPKHCTIMVEADIPSRGGWPNLAGTRVALKAGDWEPVTQVTDAFGQTVFESVATADLPRLAFEVERNNQES